MQPIQIIECVNSDFADINNSELAMEAERKAVISSFVGDYHGAVYYATINETAIDLPPAFFQKANLPAQFSTYLDSLSDSGQESAKLFEYYLTNPIDSLSEVFNEYQIKDAKEYIVAKAKNYHFLLINEAHYCGQHRGFTAELLEPLWNLGYRYLALEGLRNYADGSAPSAPPKIKDGYYIREANFGLMLREAYRLGFELIPYEAINSSEGTAREHEQALNIFNNTLAKDSVGKVIVHAGYSHIFENGDEKFRPMANILKSISKKEILSIDQQNMTEMLEVEKMNPFYRYAITNYKIEKPSVFVNKSNKALVDIINCLGIDVQVYHPQTNYIHGRPNWMVNQQSQLVKMPKKFDKYENHLVEIRYSGEDCGVVPVDRFIISNTSENNYFLLKPGAYNIIVLDKQGNVVSSSPFSVD